jgi:DNA-binding MarR family transcriptional regulator
MTSDLTPRQLAVLVAGAQSEGPSQTEIVDSTGIDRSTLSELVVRLQKKGLVQRRRTKEDARAYAVKLTDEGRRTLAVAEPLAKKINQRILDALPSAERKRFMENLASIADALKQTFARDHRK